MISTKRHPLVSRRCLPCHQSSESTVPPSVLFLNVIWGIYFSQWRLSSKLGMLSWGKFFIQHSSTSPSFEHLLFQSRSRRLFWIEQIQSFPNIFENFLLFTWDRPPNCLRCCAELRVPKYSLFFSFLSLEGLPEVPTIEFYPADVYMQSKLDIPFHFRNRNVLSSSRLIY